MIDLGAPNPLFLGPLAFPQLAVMNAAAQLPQFALPALLNAFSAAAPVALQALTNPLIPPFLSMPSPASVLSAMAPIAGGGYAPQQARVDLAPFSQNDFIARAFDPNRREAARMELGLRADPLARAAFEQSIGGRIVSFGSACDGRFTIERFPPAGPAIGSGSAINPLAAAIQGITQQMAGAALAANPFAALALGGLTNLANLLGMGPQSFASFQGGVQGMPLFGMGSASWNPLAQPGKINGSNPIRENVSSDQVHSILSDPSLTMEDKIMLAMMLICAKMDDDIKRQTEYLNQLQNQQGNRDKMGKMTGLVGTAAGAYFGGPTGAKIGASLGSKLGGAGKEDAEKSIDLESKKLERMITKRSQLFDTMGKIMERYDQSAKNVIQSMRG